MKYFIIVVFVMVIIATPLYATAHTNPKNTPTKQDYLQTQISNLLEMVRSLQQQIAQFSSSSSEKKDGQISFFLVSPSKDMSGDISRYLVSVTKKAQSGVITTNTQITDALTGLFNSKKLAYGESGLYNYLYLSNLSVDNVSSVSGVTIVEINGSLKSGGLMGDVFIPRQIEKTIEQYSNNYLIKLNGSDSAWKCAFDASGLCKVQYKSTCPDISYNLWKGKSDKNTKGDVTRLQNFLKKEGVYPEALITGYYGNLTAKAVMKWQKLHGMNFVNINSGVGSLTRAEIKKTCTL